jgi:cation diffusion facilitator CzcD-associated flavoprotein CzcO
LNPHWSKELCDQPEILEYMEGTVDKFGLREFMEFEVECLGAVWNERAKKWVVGLASREGKARKEWEVECDIFISAVGGISAPREAKFEGLEEFQGKVFHTARWDHGYDYKGKRMAIVGNGCSAAQVVPAVVKDVGSLKQCVSASFYFPKQPAVGEAIEQKTSANFLPDTPAPRNGTTPARTSPSLPSNNPSSPSFPSTNAFTASPSSSIRMPSSQPTSRVPKQRLSAKRQKQRHGSTSTTPHPRNTTASSCRTSLWVVRGGFSTRGILALYTSQT